MSGLNITVPAPTSSGPHRPAPPASQRHEVDDVDRAPLILVVDDYEDARDMYAECLSTAGYRVAVAGDGQEALDMIAKDKPALVLMDLAMPVLDGWAATKLIKSSSTTSDVIVLAITGHVTERALAMATEAGAEHVLAKPCPMNKVVEVVAALLAKRHQA